MNVLIVTHVFPPLNVIGAQRTYSWAKYWAKAGHVVCVLTTQKETFDGAIDSDFDLKDIRLVKVEEVKYWPFSKQKLTTKTLNQNSKSTSNFLTAKIRPLSKKIRQKLGMGAVFSVRNFWIRPAVKKGVSLHKQYNFDCLVSSYGPPAPHLVASQLQKRLKIPWVADYRDLWYGSHYQDAAGVFSWIQKNVEDRAVSKASLLTTVSEPLRDALETRFKKKTLTIENGFDVSEIAEPISLNAANDKNKITLVYTGTVRRGQQCVIPLFEAIQALNLKSLALHSQLEVLFYGRELGEIPELIDSYKLSQIVKISGYVNRKEILAIQRQADALIFLDWKDTTIDGILSGKIFEYLHAGTPILGVGSYSRLAPGHVLEASGCGLCLEDSSERIESVINQLLAGYLVPYSPNPSVLQRYSRQTLAEKMIEQISEIVNENSSC